MGTLDHLSSWCKTLDERRRALGMTYAILAKRSGVSQASVVRILSGKQPSASFDHVLAIARSLGIDLRASCASPEEFQKTRAAEKADSFVRMAQGTMGLEGQAVGQDLLSRLKQQTVQKLLAGSKLKLWRD